MDLSSFLFFSMLRRRCLSYSLSVMDSFLTIVGIASRDGVVTLGAR
jgi:hypothetical protein